MLIHKVGEGSVTLGGIANDRCRLTIAGTKAEALERRYYAVVLRGIDVVRYPAKGAEDLLERRHGKEHAIVDVELPIVAIDQNAEVVQMVLSGIHDSFPYRSFLQFAVTGHAIRVEARICAASNRKSLRDSNALSHGTGGDVDARKNRTRVTVQDAFVGA